MLRRRSAALLAALSVAACTALDRAGAPAGGPPAPTQPDWQRTMRQVGLHYDILAAELGKTPVGDLRAAADAASAAATLLQHGYGVYEDKRVPGFARMSRDAESWLLQVALEARQAHGEIARDLFRGGKQQYCGRCHDAAKVRPW